MHDNINNIVEIAETITQTSAAEIRQRPHGGLDRDRDAETYDPAIVGRSLDGERPETLPTVGPGPRPLVAHAKPYCHSDGISRLDWAVRDAVKRRVEDELGETKKAAQAYAELVAAADVALAAVADIPAAMARAAAARSAQLESTDGTAVVLPSVADARAVAEAHAGRLCRDALALAEAYRKVVSDTADERLQALASEAPKLADVVVDKVADLRSDIEALRVAVAELADAAGQESGRMARRLPTETKLEILDDLAEEVRQLAEIAGDPSEPAVHPRLEERAAIIRRSNAVPGGLTEEVLELARIERQEAYRITAHTRAIRDETLENFIAQRVNFGGAYLR